MCLSTGLWFPTLLGWVIVAAGTGTFSTDYQLRCEESSICQGPFLSSTQNMVTLILGGVFHTQLGAEFCLLSSVSGHSPFY